LKSYFIDSSRAVADYVSKLIGYDSEKYQILYNYILNNENAYSNRASRVLCMNAELYPDLFDPFYENAVRNLETFKSNTIRRSFMKILTTRPAPDNEELQGVLMDYCFRVLPDPKQEIAIRVYAMMILFEISEKIPEIKPELALTIEQVLPTGTPALKSAGKRLLFKLKRYI
jgi:hypothetical protein